MRIHKCDGPEKDTDGWASGKVALCPWHGQRTRTQIVFKSMQTKRRLDTAAGVQGTDRGGYISGKDSGR
jgi:hypothetical protein